MNYQEFLSSKKVEVPQSGIEHGVIHPALFGFQNHIEQFLLSKGRAAGFMDTGLGKTIVQCEWARQINDDVLIVAPLAVAPQTIKEAEKRLGMEIVYSKDGSVSSKVTITNYHRLELFDVSRFKGVVLDESSILKGYMSKTKQFLCDSFRDTPYKLACTATPAPNDYMEIGNHSQFLGIMDSTEMLTRWFINDQSSTGTYRLKGHAVRSFWEWVGSWAACVTMPSDLGFSDEGYSLPPMSVQTHTVDAPMTPGEEGMLFSLPSVSATDLHATKRLTLDVRCKLVADLVNSSAEPWIVWCESNEESSLLSMLIPDAVEVKGSDTPEAKELRMTAFSDGQARVIVSKPSICGFGMNWQHCRKMAFASISYSYESFYQAIRRIYRFGQLSSVEVHVCISDAELPVWRTIERKAQDHQAMKDHMRIAAGVGKSSEVKIPYNPTHEARLPEWLVGGRAA